MDGRVRFSGPQTEADLARSYAAADVLVLPSRAETYGMVVTEALARGLPVVAAEVGGVPEALGHGADGARPGLLVPPDDPAALRDALRAWLEDADLRGRLRRAARERRASLSRLVDDHVCRGRRPRGGGAMTVEAIRVSPGWLDLREGADAAARSRELVAHLRRRLPAGGPWVIHDLACGSGSMGRWLAPLLPGPQRWILHDRDADLLALAAADVPGRPPTAPPSPSRPGCPTSRSSAADDLAGATLITASALLDLLTEDELTALIRACAGAGCPVLLTLSVTGRVQLAPADPLDARVAAAFDAHQRRMTPRGRLLGPDAVAAAATGSAGCGAEVVVRPSPWRLGAGEADLAAEWLTGWVGAACEQEPGLAAEADLYRRRRLREAEAGPPRRHRRPRRPVGAAVRSRSSGGRASGGRGAPRSPPSSGASAPARSSTASRAVDGRALLAAAAIGLAHHRLLCMAVDDRRPRPRRPPVAARRRRGLLPVGVPQPHAPRRRRRRRPSRRQPRPRRATTSAGPCGPSAGNARPGSSCRPC